MSKAPDFFLTLVLFSHVVYVSMAPLPDYHISFETLLSFVIVFYIKDEVQARSGKGCSLNWRCIYKVNLFMRKCSGLLFRRGQVSQQFPQHS